MVTINTLKVGSLTIDPEATVPGGTASTKTTGGMWTISYSTSGHDTSDTVSYDSSVGYWRDSEMDNVYVKYSDGKWSVYSINNGLSDTYTGTGSETSFTTNNSIYACTWSAS